MEHDSASLRDLSNIEMIASKVYHPSGVVTVSIYFQSAIFVTLVDASVENPLLDSRFPDITKKSRGFQIQSFTEVDAPEHWPQLRKVQLWRRSSDKEDSKLPSREADAKASERERESISSDYSEYHDTDNERHLREGREGESWIQDDRVTVTIDAGRAETKGSQPALHTPAKQLDREGEGEQTSSTQLSPTTMVVHRDFPLVDDNSDSKADSGRERIDLSSISSPDGTDRAQGAWQGQLSERGTTVTPEAKTSLSSDAKTGNATTPSPTSLRSINMDFKNSNSSIKAARPHHLPSLKLEGRLEFKDGFHQTGD